MSETTTRIMRRLRHFRRHRRRCSVPPAASPSFSLLLPPSSVCRRRSLTARRIRWWPSKGRACPTTVAGPSRLCSVQQSWSTQTCQRPSDCGPGESQCTHIHTGRNIDKLLRRQRHTFPSRPSPPQSSEAYIDKSHPLGVTNVRVGTSRLVSTCLWRRWHVPPHCR